MTTKNTKPKIDKWILSLAALLEALSQIKSLAERGIWVEAVADQLINSLFVISPTSLSEIYPDPDAFQHGYLLLYRILTLNSHVKLYKQHLKYASKAHVLARKLLRDPKKQKQLQQRLGRIHQQALHFGPTHTTVLANLADVYIDIFSNMGQRIMVIGNAKYLQIDWHVNQIRALLLAAIRALVLWKQLGGNFYHLVYHRKAICHALAKQIKRGLK